MTGEEFKAARATFSAALGRKLSQTDMAVVIGLADPTGNGRDTVRKWEDGDGPSGPVSTLVEFVLNGLTSERPDVASFCVEWILDSIT